MSLPNDCTHLDTADEAEDGRGQEITVFLCGWPDANPDKLVNAPRWLNRLVGPGLAITPARDCAGCPAYRSKAA